MFSVRSFPWEPLLRDQRFETSKTKLDIHVPVGSWLLALSKIPAESKPHDREAGGTKEALLKLTSLAFPDCLP